MKASLYLCYQSILDPLTQTQVVAYLEGLARSAFEVVLLTFEPRALTPAESSFWQRQMANKGISWYSLRYHKHPTVPATGWDIMAGIRLGLGLVKRYDVGLLHARSHIPGIIALVLRKLTETRILFDLRGFMAEEYADAGIWSVGGFPYRTIKRAERAILGAAEGIIVLTTRALDLLNQWYPKQTLSKPVQIIPCCVDLRHLAWDRNLKREMGSAECCTMTYAGKLGGWYLDTQMVEFFEVAAKTIPNLRLQVWTQSESTSFRNSIAQRGLSNQVVIGQLSPSELSVILQQADAGVSLIKPCLSKRASSPTKVGEYLAAGLPVISTAGIGDLDELLENGDEGPVGVIIKELNPSGYADAAAKLKTLLQEPHIRERCHGVAKKYLDLETIGWVRYREMYQNLLNR